MVSGTPGTESMRKDVGAMLCTKGVTPQGRGEHRHMGRARICSGLDYQGRLWQSPKRWSKWAQGLNIHLQRCRRKRGRNGPEEV